MNERRIKLLEDELERRKTVVVADDEQVISNTLSMILRQAGYTVYTAYSGEEVVELSETLKPSVVLTDVIMPGIDGIEAGKKVKDTIPGCTVILFRAKLLLAICSKEQPGKATSLNSTLSRGALKT